MKNFNFEAFQNKMQMPSHDIIIFKCFEASFILYQKQTSEIYIHYINEMQDKSSNTIQIFVCQ